MQYHNVTNNHTTAVKFMLGCSLGRIVGEADKWLRNGMFLDKSEDPYWYIKLRNRAHSVFVREAKIQAGFYV